MKTEEIHGITYQHPVVTLLHASPLVNAELAGRVCYDSFGNSEHAQVREFNGNSIEDVEHSELLDSLCHVYHHMSIAEHANLTYLIKGTSRAVLQEHARHRIQAISVRSTRYTMSSVINAYVACKLAHSSTQREAFLEIARELDLFVIQDPFYVDIELCAVFDKLEMQYNILGLHGFLEIAVAKSLQPSLQSYASPKDLYEGLQAGKKKRNVGDAFKHIVSDNWKVDMVVTFNLRSLKNYFTLRDSGAAYFQIQWLAQAMKDVTPKKYLDLIIKSKS